MNPQLPHRPGIMHYISAFLGFCIFIGLAILSFFVFSYLLIIGAIIAFIFFIYIQIKIRWLKHKHNNEPRFHAKHGQNVQKGRTIDQEKD